MDISEIVNGIGAVLIGLLTIWFAAAYKRDIKRKNKNGKT